MNLYELLLASLADTKKMPQIAEAKSGGMGSQHEILDIGHNLKG